MFRFYMLCGGFWCAAGELVQCCHCRHRTSVTTLSMNSLIFGSMVYVIIGKQRTQHQHFCNFIYLPAVQSTVKERICEKRIGSFFFLFSILENEFLRATHMGVEFWVLELELGLTRWWARSSKKSQREINSIRYFKFPSIWLWCVVEDRQKEFQEKHLSHIIPNINIYLFHEQRKAKNSIWPFRIYVPFLVFSLSLIQKKNWIWESKKRTCSFIIWQQLCLSA